MSTNQHVYSKMVLNQSRDHTVSDDIVTGSRDHQIKRVAIKMRRVVEVLGKAIGVEKEKKFAGSGVFRDVCNDDKQLATH